MDVKPAADKACHAPCVAAWVAYEACGARLRARAAAGDHDGTCEPWAHDYWRCVDKCAAPKVFATLK